MPKHLIFCVLLCVGSALSAQDSGTIRGTVTDSVTGRPFVNARLALGRASVMRGVRTDSAGRFVLRNIPSGIRAIEVRCPTRTLLGISLGKRQVNVEAGKEVELSVLVPPGGCFEPDLTSSIGTYRGYYTVGFEESGFSFCPKSPINWQGKRIPGEYDMALWTAVRFAKSVADQHIKWPPADTTSGPYERYFVKWHGTLNGPGMYGHMGVGAYEFVVDSIYEVRAPKKDGDDCR